MHSFFAWILVTLPGILFTAQLISSINFRLAQRLRIQEEPSQTDPIVQRAERYVAYWDLPTLVWMPISGVLMLMESPTWPIVGLFAAAIYIDASGREAAKILAFKREGLRLGSAKQHHFFLSTYLIMAVLGLGLAVYASLKLLPTL